LCPRSAPKARCASKLGLTKDIKSEFISAHDADRSFFHDIRRSPDFAGERALGLWPKPGAGGEPRQNRRDVFR
jgi:hypothetical protein